MKGKMKTVWDLTPLFQSDADPKIEEEKREVEEASYKFINKWKDRNDYLTNAPVLREALDEYEEWNRKYGVYGNIGYYFGLRQSLEEDNPTLKAKSQKIDDFGNRISNEIQFFYLRLGKIPEETQKKFLAARELLPYRHYLERLFVTAKYRLTEPEEKILTLKAGPAYGNWVQMVSSFLAKEEGEVLGEDGKKKKESFAKIQSLYRSQNRRVRDRAVEVFNEILKKHADVAEAEVNAVVNDHKVNDELRGLSRPDLGRHLGDDIDSEVVDAMVEAVSRNNGVSADFYRLKAELFGVSKLRYHDRVVPYGKIDKKKYSYDEAYELVGSVFGELDGEFREIFERLNTNGQVDVFPNKGKRGGAFCAKDLLTAPTYVLLNHTDKLADVTTIAHEFGHAINNELMRAKQNALNFDSPLSTAEVASTFMEDFVFERLAREADDETRLSLLMMKLDDDVATIFRQVACYRFEQELHKEIREKGYLSKDEIGKLFQKHMATYMGEFVEQSEGSENWWVYWSHIRNFFYVYSYASGLLISKSLQGLVREDRKAISKVKEFLSAGTSDSPKKIFLNLGINITEPKFWEKGILETRELLKEAQELARKLRKTKN